MATALRSCAAAIALLCRRSNIAVLMILSYLAAMIGYPIWEPAIGKDQSEAYPCQFSACGCRTAEQCRQSCCCHTKKDKVAWALQRNIDPHKVAILTSDELNRYISELLATGEIPVTPKSCCSHKAVAQQATAETAPAKSCCQKKASSGKIRFTLGMQALGCGGNATKWIQAGLVALPAPVLKLELPTEVPTLLVTSQTDYLSPTLGQLLRPA